MKINFKKISAIASSVLLTGMTMGIAAAANYPAPFVSGGVADVAIVYGTGAGVSNLDIIQAGNIQTNLQSSMSGTTTGASTSVSGGDNVLLAKASDNINVGDNLGVFTGTIDNEDLKTLLKKGTYVAYDNDEFDYEQSIKIGTPEFEHFRDSDYEDLVGLSSKTPILGFKIASSTWIMNYTMDFTTDAESDLTSGNDLDDIEKSDITLLGKNYYVSDLANGTSAVKLAGKLTLLDSANTGIVSEGETVTVTVGSKTYTVSLSSLTTTEAKFIVNGVTTNSLTEGSSFKLSDGAYIGVKDIFQRDVSGVTGNVEFSIGSGKVEITSGAEIKLNDETIDGVSGWVYKGTASGATEKLDKIVIQWNADEEMFLTPKSELKMPGFGAVKFTMGELHRPVEEKITIEKDSDTSVELNVPIKDGTVSFNILYAKNATGDFGGTGKASDDRLAISPNNTLLFHEKWNGNDFHSYFVASYNVTAEAESYLLRAKVSYDTTVSREEVTIDKYANGGWTAICEEKTNGSTCDIGDVSLTLDNILYQSGGNETVTFKGGTNVNFNTIYTAGGLRIWLPYDISLITSEGGYANSTRNASTLGWPQTARGALNLTKWVNMENASGYYSLENESSSLAGHSYNNFWLYMEAEDKDDNIAAGKKFNLTIDATSSGPLQVSQVNDAGSGSALGLELQETSTYELYLNGSAVAPKVLHYTNPDEDYAEVYYPIGDSETYTQVYLAENAAVITSTGSTTTSATQLGEVLVKDTEVASVSTKNLVIVGGSCINAAAAKVLGGAKCGTAFTDATGIGTGQFLIQSVADSYTTGKIALVVAGYDATDTVNAATYLKTQTVDTTAGKKYKGTSSTSAELVVSS